MYREAASDDRSIIIVALGGAVVGLDRRSGRERWRNELSGGGIGVVDVAITHGRVFVTASSSVLVCLDYANGKTVWSAKTQGSGRGTILVDDGQVIVAKNGYVDCFDFSGNRLWSEALSGMGIGRAAVGLPGNVRQADDIGGQ